MDMLIRLIMVIITQVYLYQYTLYTLYVYNFYLSIILLKSRKNPSLGIVLPNRGVLLVAKMLSSSQEQVGIEKELFRNLKRAK